MSDNTNNKNTIPKSNHSNSFFEFLFEKDKKIKIIKKKPISLKNDWKHGETGYRIQLLQKKSKNKK